MALHIHGLLWYHFIVTGVPAERKRGRTRASVQVELASAQFQSLRCAVASKCLACFLWKKNKRPPPLLFVFAKIEKKKKRRREKRSRSIDGATARTAPLLICHALRMYKENIVDAATVMNSTVITVCSYIGVRLETKCRFGNKKPVKAGEKGMTDIGTMVCHLL